MMDNTALMINDAASTSASSEYTPGSSFGIEHRRETMNRILAEANLSPVRSQTTAALRKQSNSGIRRLVSKLRRGTRAFQGIF